VHVRHVHVTILAMRIPNFTSDHAMVDGNTACGNLQKTKKGP